MIIDKYLYEIIDDYKHAESEEEKAEAFKDFCSSIWKSKNKRRTYKKTIKFKVRNDLLDSEIGQIFNIWSEIDYVGYKEMSKDTDWSSLIRQKVNNLYTRYFDKEVILNKEYMDLLKTPKNLYYRWIKGAEIEADDLTMIIDESIYKSNKYKEYYQKQKMDLSWDEYKSIIEGFFNKIFDNCILIEDYETKHLTNQYIYELATEDNFYIRYICDSLESYMRNYQKKYYGLYVPSYTKQNKKYGRCKECGDLIEKTGNKKMYCDKCATNKERERKRKIAYKYRKLKVAK